MWTFPHEKVDTQHWPLPAPILLNIAPWPLLTHQYLMQTPSRHSSACCPSSILMIHMIRRSNWWDDIFGLNWYFSRARNTSWAESSLLLHHERPPLSPPTYHRLLFMMFLFPRHWWCVLVLLARLLITEVLLVLLVKNIFTGTSLVGNKNKAW